MEALRVCRLHYVELTLHAGSRALSSALVLVALFDAATVEFCLPLSQYLDHTYWLCHG